MSAKGGIDSAGNGDWVRSKILRVPTDGAPAQGRDELQQKVTRLKSRTFKEGLGLGDELADVHSDVAGDCPEESRRDVTTLVKRNGRHPPIRVAVLAVRTTLTDLNESEFGKYGGDFTRLQDRHIAHGLGDLHRLRPYELPFELWGTVLEQHGDDLLEVLV